MIFTKFFVYVAYGRRSASVLLRRHCDVFLVLWMTSCFSPTMGHVYEFHYDGPITFTYLLQSRTELNFILLKRIILTNYFEVTCKLR